MQLSNEPAEELANVLIESSNGAFDLCGFVSGGSEAMEAVIKLGRQVGEILELRSAGVYQLLLSSISLKLVSSSARITLLANYPITVIL